MLKSLTKYVVHGATLVSTQPIESNYAHLNQTIILLHAVIGISIIKEENTEKCECISKLHSR